MDYNSDRNHLIMKEYGRHIQKMVVYLCTIEDDAKRQEQTNILIDLMGFLNPHLKNVEDYKHKLWDHLFLMSDFKLKVESPYPIPEKETYKLVPAKLPYPKRKPRYNHLGKNLELVIDKALAEQDPEKKVAFSNTIAYYMKLSYNNWHKENIHDETIRAELTAITKGELNFTETGYVKYYRANEGRNNNNNNRNNNQRNFKQNNNRPNNGTSNVGANRPNNNNRPNNSGANNNGANNGGQRNNNFKKRY
jgi:hypothetical protein